jgi:hypothetical protein
MFVLLWARYATLLALLIAGAGLLWASVTNRE